MKRNFVVSLFGSFVGCGLLLILLGVAGSADAHGATTQSGQSASRPVGISIATPLTSTFTYQGQLKSGGVPVNNTCNLQFGLWNSASGGVQVSGTTTQTVPNVSVSNGLLTASIDFGANAFTGDARYLAIAVACPPGSGYVPMSTRQAITAIPYAVLAGNANQLNGQDASAFVTVSGPQTISGPKTFTDGVKFLDGTTQTTAFYRPALPGPGAATTVDTTGIVGQGTSIAIGADGLGLISYIYKPADQLKVYHCDNAACTTGITTTLGNTTWVDGSTSLTIGADGLGLISYWDSINADLKVFHCDNVVCTSGTPTTLDSTGIVGGFAAITTGADGLGLISYYDQTNGDLKVFHCANAICISGTATTLDSTGDVGQYTSITIGADGLGLISYYDVTNANLKAFHCANAACTNGTATTLDSTGDVGQYTSITLGADGLGLISYYDVTNANLKVFHCANAACTSGAATTLDSTGDVGQYTSLTVGADGLGLISYYDYISNLDLKVFHCANVACTSGTPTAVDGPSDVGQYTSLTVGADGLGLISYYDNYNKYLKIFHCSNLACTPHTRVGR